MQDLSFSRTPRHGPRPVPAWDRLDNRGSDKPEPISQQVARPYQMLMMKGLQLRAYDTDVELDAAMERERQVGRHAQAFKYVTELGRYVPGARTIE
jgi:hypothetical protein